MDADTLAVRVLDALFDESFQPPCAWLFGSLARGDGHARSDIDVAVLLWHRPSSTLSGMGLSLAGRLSPELVPALRDMSGFRNIVVHGEQEVDVDVLEDVLTHRLSDLATFCDLIRRSLRA